MLDVLDSQYIVLARSKGVRRASIVWNHALRNALIPPLTYGTILIANFVVGAVVVETVFAWPGIGRLAIEGAVSNDFPLVAALSMFFALVFVISSLAADVAYALIDPRVRFA
jgi:peptide/nickel transport system permease protein